MDTGWRRTSAVLALTLSIPLLWTSAAYARGGVVFNAPSGDHENIYVARSNGQNKTLVKRGCYIWTSMDDNGKIWAENCAGTKMFRMNQSGRVSHTMLSPLGYSTGSCPTSRADHLLVSPDGTKIALDAFICDHTSSFWAPSSATYFATNDQGAGQEDFHAPAWMGASRLLLSHVGVRPAGGNEMGVYKLGDGQNTTSDWFDADEWATSFASTISRDGKKIAVYEDDAADYFDGAPRNVEILLFSTSGYPAVPTLECRIDIPVAKWLNTAVVTLAFDPAGTRLAWDENQSGTWIANTRDLSDCSTLDPHLFVRNAYELNFSKAATP